MPGLAPTAPTAPTASAAASLPITLQNNSGSSTVYAYTSGADSSGWPGFVTADGVFHRLSNPSTTLTPVPDYANAVTNHYARLVHKYASIGYASPYDDVGPTGSTPVDGHLQDYAPTSWTVALGSSAGG
ncbi:beta-1,3-glucanase family protein [Streptomyces hyaluromycini]|uniref:Beta-1,3-glucanase family protein n=1 Tax=Streptomyces hyaluromycini TaxID=1377993 RepID=A0ABV1X039_9ACTN